MLLKNYIPHKTPRYPNYNKWFNEYKNHILNLYGILQEIISKKYPNNKIDWESNIIFNQFCFMVYNSSSKYVPKWI